MKKYYEVLQAHNDLPLPAQAKKHGTAAYGYATLALAKRYCPGGCYVQERHSEHGSDWAGLIVWQC